VSSSVERDLRMWTSLQEISRSCWREVATPRLEVTTELQFYLISALPERIFFQLKLVTEK